ncbi:uncharacterized protein LOC124622021 [Schistocerca americana]|uniref:uncharacterized protein LOC124622021 n=1 Tax=Schistocerca americana TaxID=7009 RepID=UPI001F4F770D|nr:uncharacterized protein LOC124622021 [Schistocerca americana]
MVAMPFPGACAPVLLLVCSISLWRMTSCGPPPKKLGGTAGGGADDPSWSPLTVAHCRATCLKEFSEDFHRDASCMQHPDCFACWQNCEMLHANWSIWSSMCSEKTSCFPGCRAACRFFAEFRASPQQQRQLQPVRETSAADLLVVLGVELRWPRPPRAGAAAGAGAGADADAGRLVYVVMWRPNDTARWAQVTQTLERRARLPATPGASEPRQVAAGSARVLVVDPGGLRTVYTPAGARQPSADADAAAAAAAVAATLSGGAAALGSGLVAAPAGWVLPEEKGGVWSVRVQSLIHQGVLVIAELSWRVPPKEAERQRRAGHQYLVTWEVDGGGITGNLYTDSTCVTLSLWPDTVFHIQVELVSRSESVSRSRPLVVDTGRLGVEGLSAGGGVGGIGAGGGVWLQGVAGPIVGAALKAVVALFALFFCYRGSFLRRHHQEPEKAALIVDFEDEPCKKDSPLNPVWTGIEKEATPLEEKCNNIHV